MRKQEFDFQITGSKILGVLLGAMAQIEQLELTDAELGEFEKVLEGQLRALDSPLMPMIDPTGYRELMWRKKDIEIGLSRLDLMREIKRHWDYDMHRLKGGDNP